jgi:glutathione S-transferase
MKILSNPIETLSKRQIKEAIEAKNKLNKELMLWDMYLQDNTYIVNKTFTLADCGTYPVIACLVHHGLNLIKYPYINRYYILLKQHPSMIKSSPICWGEYSNLNIFEFADSIKTKKMSNLLDHVKA